MTESAVETWQRVSTIGRSSSSPLLIYDSTAVRHELDFLEAHLESVASPRLSFHIYYSVKANMNPNLLRWFAEQGHGAEVSSMAEFGAARLAGFRDISATSPGFGAAELCQLVESGVEVNIDNLRQLDHLPDGAAIGLRLCTPLQESSFRLDKQSRFGIEIDSSELHDKLHFKKCKVVRLHGHTRDIGDASELREHVSRLVAAMAVFKNVLTVNLGGGMTRLYKDTATAKEAWLACRSSFAALPIGTRIVVEPGAQLVTRHGYLCTQAISSNLRSDGRQLVVVNSSKWNLVSWSPYGLAFPELESGDVLTDVLGPTCYENDVWLANVRLPRLEDGCRLIFSGMGAYVSSMARTMHGLLVPAELVI